MKDNIISIVIIAVVVMALAFYGWDTTICWRVPIGQRIGNVRYAALIIAF